MRVIDSSAWIEVLIKSELGLRLKDEIPEAGECAVPTLVQHELAKWLTREQSLEQCEKFIAFTMTCNIVPLDSSIALHAAEMARSHGLATADAIIYATAIHLGCALVTCDAHFAELPRVIYFDKRKT